MPAHQWRSGAAERGMALPCKPSCTHYDIARLVDLPLPRWLSAANRRARRLTGWAMTERDLRAMVD
jgi:hypothetical protein